MCLLLFSIKVTAVFEKRVEIVKNEVQVGLPCSSPPWRPLPVSSSYLRKSKMHTCVFFFPAMPCSRWGLSSQSGDGTPTSAGEALDRRAGGPFHILTCQFYPGSLGSVPGSQHRHSRSLPAYLLLFTLWVQCFQTGPSEHLPKRDPQSTCLNAAARAPAMSIGICGGI